MVILHAASMIRELPSSGPTSCMFHALFGVHRSFSWSFIIHHVPSLSIVHHLIYTYIHTYIWFFWQHLLSTIQSTSSSIIHHPHPTLSSGKMFDTVSRRVATSSVHLIPLASLKAREKSAAPALFCILAAVRDVCWLFKNFFPFCSSCFLGLLLDLQY